MYFPVRVHTKSCFGIGVCECENNIMDHFQVTKKKKKTFRYVAVEGDETHTMIRYFSLHA